MKKQLLNLIIVVIAVIGSYSNSYASHFAAGNITYKCLGGNDYLITLAFYRDCSGISAPTSVTVTFNCTGNSTFNFTKVLTAIPGTGQEVTPGCNANPTRCVSPTGGYGLREHVYQAQVTLPPCSLWYMSQTDCCRNPSNTISAPTSQSWYLLAMLNNTGPICNSSPQFTNKPTTVMCSGQTFCFNHGALDPDGDSLSYSFYTPLTTSPTSTVTYIGGYSFTQPVPSVPPVTINPITGDVCMTPLQNIVSPFGIRVDEWRTINGVPKLIGSIYRDIQVNVVTCNNTIPKLSGMDTLLTHKYKTTDTTYFIEKCLGVNIKFDINGFDGDTFNPANIGQPHIMFITWNNGIPGGTFTTQNNGTDSAYATFSWIPNKMDVSNTPKCFTATVRDNACPYNGSQTFSYCITIRGMAVELGSDTLLCKGESFMVNATADTTTKNHIWRINGINAGLPTSATSLNFNSTTYPPGIHLITIETNDGGTTTKCPGRDTVKVNVVYQPNVNLGRDTVLCEGQSIVLNAGPGGLFVWSHGSFTQTLTVDTVPGGVYWVVVDGGQYTRCTDIDTIEVRVLKNPKLGPDTCLWEQGAKPYYIQSAGEFLPPINYKWNTGATTKTIDVNTSGNYSVTVSHPTISSNKGCSGSRIINVIDEDNAIISYKVEATGGETYLGPGDQQMCSHNSMKITGISPPAGHTYAYSWSVDGTPKSTGSYIVLTKQPVGIHNVVLNVGGGCLANINVDVKKCDLLFPNVITPNNDGNNDKFNIKGLEYYPNSSLIIFNRWGKKIYEHNNYQNDWDGSDNSDGVYYFVLKLADGEDSEFNGIITILKQ